MSVFLDASALVAMIAGEDDAGRLEIRMKQEAQRLISAIARWETVVALCRSHEFSWKEAQDSVDDFCREFDVECVQIGELESRLALNIFARFGKGNHPARLNLGDCFAAACAKANEAWLLFKGADFSKTDLSWIGRA